LLIVGSTLVDYVAAIQMSKTSHQGIRKLYLASSLIINLGLLFPSFQKNIFHTFVLSLRYCSLI